MHDSATDLRNEATAREPKIRQTVLVEGSVRTSLPVLRPMERGDLDPLLAVQREGAQVGFANIFPQEQFPFPVQVVRDRWESELADPGVECFVVVDDDRAIAGFAALRGNELLHFGTAVRSWGSGLAGRAHDEVLAQWTSRGYQHAWLRVFEDNLRARRFYERRGWMATGERTRSHFPPRPVLLSYELELAGRSDRTVPA